MRTGGTDRSVPLNRPRRRRAMARRGGATWLGGVLWLLVAANGAGAANWADGLFAEKKHDFGPVPRGGKFRHDFVLTNRLAGPVTILKIPASCGCTTGRVSASQLTPGQSATVEAEMDTRNFVGVKATVLHVTLVT